MNLCKIGFHGWEIIQEEKYKDALSMLLGMPSQYKHRKCRRCEKTQWQEVHCLGLNPPKYLRCWYNLEMY